MENVVANILSSLVPVPKQSAAAVTHECTRGRWIVGGVPYAGFDYGGLLAQIQSKELRTGAAKTYVDAKGDVYVFRLVSVGHAKKSSRT